MNSQWFKTLPVAITVSDKEGKIVDMNDQSAAVFSKQGGYELIGKALNDCHSQRSKDIIHDLMTNSKTNVYTIEKEGKHKLIYQCPWYMNGEIAGLVELSMVLPSDIPHYVR